MNDIGLKTMNNDEDRSREHSEAEPRGGVVGMLRDWLRSLGVGTDPATELTEDIAEVIEERREAQLPINPQERRMLLNILRFGELRLDDVMVPRADIVALDAEASLTEVVKIFRDAEHSRLPVYRESLDDVIGMVHIKDVFKFWGDETGFKLSSIVRKVLFVAPSMPVLDLLLQMQANHIHMAMVVDEYGGIDGLATIEDLVEQIVGDIEDEHDVDSTEDLIERADGEFDASGRTPVEQLEEKLEVNLIDRDSEEEIETLGGLVQALSGRVPQRGELVRHPGGLEFEVTDADPRRIKRLRIRRFFPPVAEA